MGKSEFRPRGSASQWRVLYAAIGGLQGLLLYLLVKIAEDWSEEPLLQATGITIAFTPPIFYVLATSIPLRSATIWALGAGAGLFLLWLGFSLRFWSDGSDDGAYLVLILPAAVLLFGTSVRGQLTDGCEPMHGRLLKFGWEHLITTGAALAMGGVGIGLVALSGTLLEIAGLGFVANILQHDSVYWVLYLALAGLTFAIIHEQERLMQGVIDVIVLLARILFILAVFLIALALVGALTGGLTKMTQVDSTTALCLGLLLPAILFGHSAQVPISKDTSPTMGKLLRFGWLPLPLLAAVAIYAVALRVAQYGWTPARIVAAELSILALIGTLGMLWVGLTAGNGLEGRKTKTLMFMLGVSSVFFVTALLPYLGHLDISIYSQAKRLVQADGSLNEGAAQFLWHESGNPGKRRIAKLEEQLGETMDETFQARLAYIKENRYSRWQPSQSEITEDHETLLALPLRPGDPALPKSFVAALSSGSFGDALNFIAERCTETDWRSCWFAQADIYLPTPGNEIILLTSDLVHDSPVFSWSEDKRAWSLVYWLDTGPNFVFPERGDEPIAQSNGELEVVQPESADLIVDGTRLRRRGY